LINKVARESMTRTLESMRTRMVKSYKLQFAGVESPSL